MATWGLEPASPVTGFSLQPCYPLDHHVSPKNSSIKSRDMQQPYLPFVHVFPHIIWQTLIFMSYMITKLLYTVAHFDVINILAIFSHVISFGKTHWQRVDSNLRRWLSVNSLDIHSTIMLSQKMKHQVQK